MWRNQQHSPLILIRSLPRSPPTNINVHAFAISFALALAVSMTGRVEAATMDIPTSFGFGADTHVNLGGSSGLNKGASTANGVQEAFVGPSSTSTNSAFTARPILRFDLSALPAGVIIDAWFTFAVRFIRNTTLGLTLTGLSDGDAQDAEPGAGGWEELMINADNAPAFNVFIGNRVLVPADEVFLNSGASPIFKTFGFTGGQDALVDALNADSNDLISFMLTSGSPSLAPLPSFSFWSKEGQTGGEIAAVAPTLTVVIDESTAIPLPAALPLLATGLALFARRRRAC